LPALRCPGRSTTIKSTGAARSPRPTRRHPRRPAPPRERTVGNELHFREDIGSVHHGGAGLPARPATSASPRHRALAAWMSSFLLCLSFAATAQAPANARVLTAQPPPERAVYGNYLGEPG